MIWGDADVTIRHCLIDSVDVTIRHLTDSALFWKDIVKYFNKVLISTSISCWSFASPAHPHSSNPNRDQSNGYYVLMFFNIDQNRHFEVQPPSIKGFLSKFDLYKNTHLHTVEPIVHILILDILLIFTYTTVLASFPRVSKKKNSSPFTYQSGGSAPPLPDCKTLVLTALWMATLATRWVLMGFAQFV